MTRFNITMDEALDFILKATANGKGSEIFVPKLRAYSVLDVKNALQELIGDTGEKEIPVRPGEKIHETLINTDEMRYTLENDSNFVILNTLLTDEEISAKYPTMKKSNLTNSYSSNLVDKIPKDELKQIIKKSGLLD